MKPASTGCGTYCASRPRRSRPSTISSTPASDTASPATASTGASMPAGSACHCGSRTSWASRPAKISAVAELGPLTGKPRPPASANTRPPTPAVTSEAVTPSGARVRPSGA